jgi:hypothetical protein
VAHSCNPSYSGGGSGRSWLKGNPGQIVHETLSQKKKIYKKELVEWLKWQSTCLASVRL